MTECFAACPRRTGEKEQTAHSRGAGGVDHNENGRYGTNVEHASSRIWGLNENRWSLAPVTYDARAVANCIIDLSLEYDQVLTHLSLHKILYFIHGKHLIERSAPLVSGHFEAWQYGPVHPLIFSTYKTTRGKRIIHKSVGFDPLTGDNVSIEDVSDKSTTLFIRLNAAHFLGVSPGRLVDLAHASGSPWDILTRREFGSRVYGDRITNEHILQYFHRHIVSIRDQPQCGEPVDEQPPS